MSPDVTYRRRNSGGRFSIEPGETPSSSITNKDPKFLLALRKLVTDEDWKRIVQRAIEDAADGDRFARSWLSDHILGRPGTGPRTIDARSVNFDLSNLSDDQLRIALQLSRTMGIGGGDSEAGSR